LVKEKSTQESAERKYLESGMFVSANILSHTKKKNGLSGMIFLFYRSSSITYII